MTKDSKTLHFLGMNGSGISGVACLAKQYGYNVSGCDLTKISNYTDQLNELDIDVLEGHSVEHLDGVDELIVSAAIYFKDKYKTIPEVMEAMKRGIKITKWQEFIDNNLTRDKELICVCGTHGKTTTTTFVADMLEFLGADPSALIGGVNGKWNRGYKAGKGKYFVCESDEYGNNFWSYHPKYIIINNIEMEHPEFFKNIDNYRDNFATFIKNIRDNGILIFNRDCDETYDLVRKLKDFLLSKNVKIICYTLNNNKRTAGFIKTIRATSKEDTSFNVENVGEFKLNDIHGKHNIRNCLGVISLMLELGFEVNDIKNAVARVSLPKRRMEKIFSSNSVDVYDDYAHHHTQIFYNLSTLKNNIDKNDKIIAILEPHLISRFKNNSKQFIEYMEFADFPIITKFYKSREKDLDDLNLDEYLKGSKIKYIESFDDVIKEAMVLLDTEKYKKMHIVIMGAGLSYKLASDFVNILKM